VGDIAISGSTSTFSPYNNTFGLIKSLNFAAQPLNTNFSLPNFITFELNNTETIELTFVPLGIGTPSTDCSGLAICTPESGALLTSNNPGGLSEFNLQASGPDTVMTFQVQGTVHDISGQTGTLSGTLTAQIARMNPQQAWAQALAGTNEVFSGQLTVNSVSGVPEPATAGLIGLALMGLLIAKKRIAN
jgi:hypothetical protein